MFHGPTSRLHDFVIACKRCREHIVAPVETIPDTWIIHTCPLCGERRRYVPAEIFRGRLSHRYEDLLQKRGRVCPYRDMPRINRGHGLSLDAIRASFHRVSRRSREVRIRDLNFCLARCRAVLQWVSFPSA